MDSANKISTSVAFGISSSIISCIGCYSFETLLVDEGRYIYGYRPETVFMCSSAVVGMIVALIVFHTFTFVECYKLSKANPKLGNTFKLFVKKILSYENLLSILITMTICGLIAIGGLIVIGLAVFFIPLLKGKFK